MVQASALAHLPPSNHVSDDGSFRRKRPWRLAGLPMTLGNMRANGVRSLDVSCQCHHRSILSADRGPITCQSQKRSLPPFQTLNQIGNVITELPAGPAVVPPINGSVCAVGRRTF
jgi:hypothetical protein